MNKDFEKDQSVILENRKTLKVTGVIDILAFDETNLLLKTVLGELSAEGAELRVLGLSLEDGKITVEGRIDGVFYIASSEKTKKGLFGRKN